MCDNDTVTFNPDCEGQDGQMEGEEDLTDFKIILGFQITFVVFGVIGNGLMFALMFRKKFRGQSYAVYFIFAAVMDTANILLNCVLDASEVFDETVQIEKIAMNYGCKVFHFFEGMITMSSPWFMVLLTFDRLLAICFPTNAWAKKYCHWKTALGVSILLLVVLAVINIPLTVLTDTQFFEDEEIYDCGVPEENEIGGFFAFLTIGTLIPILALTIMNGVLAFSLFRGTVGDVQLSDQMKNIRRFNVIIFYVLFMTLLTWIPLTVVELIEVYYDLEDKWTEEFRASIDRAWKATLVIYLLTFIQNFYIFILTSAVYRYELAKMFNLHRFLKSPYETMSPDQPMKQMENGESARL